MSSTTASRLCLFHSAALLLLLLLPLLSPFAFAQPQWLHVGRLPQSEGIHALAFDSSRGRTVLFGGATCLFYYPLSETSEYDGVRWTSIPTSTSPSPRTDHAMAYDARRRRVVLFGGWSSPGLNRALDDTWEYDGTDWRQLSPPVRPPARAVSAMAYDAARDRLVLFGGTGLTEFVLGDTWEWDGTTWTPRFPAAGPGPRAIHALAYDSARQRVVLFGGQDFTGVLSDTWEWNGTTWRNAAVAGPPPRSGHAMTYVAHTARTLIYGGSGLSDTWEWDGTAWIERLVAPNPGPRSYNPLVYDEPRSRAVMIGNDIWEWDGQRWNEAIGNPGRASDLSMCFDTWRGVRVLLHYAGLWECQGTAWKYRSASVEPDLTQMPNSLAFDSGRGVTVFVRPPRTWEWNGAAWTLRTPSLSPSPRSGYAITYDSWRRRVVLFGGRNLQRILGDTWEWDGTTWTERMPTRSPGPHQNHTLVFDRGRGRTVLFGWPGQDGDIWEWDGTDWTFVEPAPGPRPTSRSYHGSAFDVNRGRVLIWGGYYPETSMWEWDGTKWWERTPSPNPGARTGLGMTFDSLEGKAVVYGGCCWNRNPSCSYRETWEYSVPSDTVGLGHEGGGLPLTLSTRPRLGARVCLSFPSAGGQGVLVLGHSPPLSRPLALDPPLVCARGFVFPAALAAFPLSGNPATFCLDLPSAPAVVGASVCCQGAALEAGGCYRLTDAMVITVQRE